MEGPSPIFAAGRGFCKNNYFFMSRLLFFLCPATIATLPLLFQTQQCEEDKTDEWRLLLIVGVPSAIGLSIVVGIVAFILGR